MSGGSADWNELKDLQKKLIASQQTLGDKLDRQIGKLDEQVTEIKNFNRSSTKLSCAMIFIGIISLGIAGWTYYNQFIAGPKLNVIFHDVNPKENIYELRVENTGAKYAEEATVHLMLPRGIRLNFNGLVQQPHRMPDNEIGDVFDYQYTVPEKILVKRNKIIGKVQFLMDKDVVSKSVRYLVVSPGAEDRYGTFKLADAENQPATSQVDMNRPATADTVTVRQ